MQSSVNYSKKAIKTITEKHLRKKVEIELEKDERGNVEIKETANCEERENS